MQVRWEYLTPPEFKKLVKEEQICILPLGILERHGEHLPYGTDGLSVHAIACRAAELEPCVVFPTYWFGQGHEASCFAGSVNFPPRLLYEMLEVLLDQIARNGFKKIVIFSGHGGNSHFLDYFAMTQLDREVDYTLYILRGAGKRQLALCCFSKRMRKVFRKNEKNMLQNCNKKAKRKGRLQRVKKPM